MAAFKGQIPFGVVEAIKSVRPGKVVLYSGCEALLVKPNQQPVASLWSLTGNC